MKWAARAKDCLISQWPLVIVLGTAFAALLNPAFGAKGGVGQYETVIPTLIIVIFFVIGLTVPISQLQEGALALRFHVLCQGYSLGLLPLAYYCLVYRWGWEVRSGLLTPDFAQGVMAAMCMPTTGFTCVMFARQAGGDESVAVFNAAIGNLLGPVVVPFTAQLAMGQKPEGNLGAQAVKLMGQLVAPLAVGTAAQVFVIACVPHLLFKVQRQAKYAFNVVLVVVLYYIFCEGFHAGARDMTATSVGLMCAWVVVVHLCAFFGAWWLGGSLPLRRRASFAFVGSQKTEGMAVAILALISPHSGLLTLPVVAYHSVQMAFSAVAAPMVRRRVLREEGYAAVCGDYIAVDVMDDDGDDDDLFTDELPRDSGGIEWSGYGFRRPSTPLDAITLMRHNRNSCKSVESFAM
eukprot:Rhum_TRINITY_DN14437_c12_g1::Rhum_TRINITY_DN14437_c12_g1_i1::g.89713::m.89713/K14347/SLC10A7, P7; solute carrier family 10 (sodium/bile acid cotransporter), member 7